MPLKNTNPLTPEQLDLLWTHWMEENGPSVLGTVRRILPCYAKTEDCASEVWVKVIDRLHDGALPTPIWIEAMCCLKHLEAGEIPPPNVLFQRWLTKVARNHAFDHDRAEEREQKHLGNLALLRESSCAVDPSIELMRNDIFEAVRSAVARLEPSDKIVVEYNFFEHRTIVEIATHLGLGERGVGRRKAKAILCLRKDLLPLLEKLQNLGEDVFL